MRFAFFLAFLCSVKTVFVVGLPRLHHVVVLDGSVSGCLKRTLISRSFKPAFALVVSGRLDSFPASSRVAISRSNSRRNISPSPSAKVAFSGPRLLTSNQLWYVRQLEALIELHQIGLHLPDMHQVNAG